MSSFMTIIEDDFDFTSTHHWILENGKLQDLKNQSSNYEDEEEDAIERMQRSHEEDGTTKIDFKFGLNIDDNHFRLLIDSLSAQSATLESLEFTFLHLNELSSSSIHYFSQALQSNQFSNLKTLHLNFLWHNIDNETLISLSKAISEGAPDLENLVLKFNSEQTFSDSSVMNLCSNLSSGLVNLESLELSLSYGTNTDASSSQDIEEQLGLNLPSLKKLKLDLNQVNDTNIEMLAKIFQNRPINLENINLHFSSCESVTSSAVRSLVESFDEGAINFKDVKIVLSGSNIASEEQKSLQRLVKRLFRRDFSLEFIF